MLSTLKSLSSQRWPWLLLAFSALALELCALFFQHVMELEPCVMCVYERITMLGIILAGFIGASAPQNVFVRISAFILWAISAVWGLLLALEHTDYQMNPSPFATCDFFPNFPTWAPLHEWLPWLFNPTGDCADIVWQFLGYSMPQWLIVSFTIYTVLFVVVAVTALLPKKA
ncbi:disulfide bond formation protein DsbB [Psychromonas sp. Urea-02u-13]|uniref:disulfide bond formation protein DsbB n=1 Tax=Psychromonas sp. Urea-02u-13 TaxID=2058326 RepID=UPI000C32D1B0|nr:disulfide bond formation protein DsbB [Psychromonas sp. Urea-02u-13]PKG39025.1 disulfide bond formation protein DsbB [Psychromonas sp. Urea-02u-13]